MKKSIKPLLFILIALLFNVSSAGQDAIIIIEDVRHISNESDVIGQNETIGNYYGSELVPGEYPKFPLN